MIDTTKERPRMSESIIDLTEWFQRDNPDVIIAQAKGYNVLILAKLQKPIQNVEKQKCRLELEHRWLSAAVETNKDENWVCVQGQDFTYYPRKEIPVADLAKGRITLFDAFQLF